MNRDETVKDMAKILCPKGTANCEKCSKSYKCDVKFSQLAQLVDGGCLIVGDDEVVLKKHEQDKLLLAQYAARKTIDEIFSLSLEKIEEAKRETAREIFVKVFATLTKCVKETGFYATDSDSDVSMNGNVIWFELEKLANERGIEIGEVE